MARTAEGSALTEQHRQVQLQVRAQALKAYIAVWPLWTGDERSFQRMMDAAVPVIQTFRGVSASLAAGYFERFRAVERPGGAAVALVASPLDVKRIRGTLHFTGVDMTRKALLAGQPPEQAMRTALIRTSGTTSRLVLDGGRDTVMQSIAEDKRSGRWARVTDGNPCAFCAMLASRGHVYVEKGTADFQAHDHDGCLPEPAYPDAALPPSAEKWSRVWDDALREASEAGEDVYGRENALNAFRRHLSRQ